jgi:hypothetical protein
VAHELGHCANIYHHGPPPLENVEWKAVVVNGGLAWKEDGVPIAVFEDPSGNPVVPRNEDDDRTIPLMGVKGDQGSGDEDCMMRYENHAYAWVGFGPTRYLVGDDEFVGNSLCTSAQGTGVNAAKPGTPWPRYGEASTGRGRCKFQICVNDAMNHAPNSR